MLAQFATFAVFRAEAGLPEGTLLTLRLLPISVPTLARLRLGFRLPSPARDLAPWLRQGGIFAGEFMSRIAPLTLTALAAGLARCGAHCTTSAYTLHCVHITLHAHFKCSCSTCMCM